MRTWLTGSQAHWLTETEKSMRPHNVSPYEPVSP
jgi:hypothetical protein